MTTNDFSELADRAAKRMSSCCKNVEYGDFLSWAWMGIDNAIGGYSPSRGKLENFVVTCIYNSIHRNLRQFSGRYCESLDSLPEGADPYSEENDPYYIVVRMERINALRDAVNRLDQPLRDAITFSVLDGMSGVSVARIMGVSRGRVYSYMQRAIVTLRADGVLREAVLG